jgi:hypothetical protein
MLMVVPPCMVMSASLNDAILSVVVRQGYFGFIHKKYDLDQKNTNR